MPLIEPKLEIAKGNYTNHSFIHQPGINDLVSSDWETVWNAGGLYPTITGTALHLSISSSATQDATGSVGANTITVTGLDANYNEVTETVSLTGTSAAYTSNTYIALNKAFIATGGASEQSGSISIFKSGSSTKLGIIESDYKQLLQSHYTVPAGHIAYLQSVNCNVSTDTSASFALYQKPSGSVYRSSAIYHVYQNSNIIDFNSVISFEEKTEIDLRAKAAPAGITSGDFSLTVVSSSDIPIQPVHHLGYFL